MSSERKLIGENVKRVLLKELLKKKTERAGFGGLDIQRTPLGTRVTLITERPGMIIGRRGATIKMLTELIKTKFQLDNPMIEVQEIEDSNLNPHIMAQKLAAALEKGWHFRRVGHSTVRRIMSANARGCQVIISGKLTGQRHRTEKFKQVHVKFCGEPAKQWMNEGFATAKKKSGVIGIKVQIMDPNARLPAEIDIVDSAPPLPTVPSPEQSQISSSTDSEQIELTQDEVKTEVKTEVETVVKTEAETEVKTEVETKGPVETEGASDNGEIAK